LAVISIFGATDVVIVSSHTRGGPVTPSDSDEPVVMQLLADGVPLELLVDIALRPSSPLDPENPGYYRL
jgi:hypothetical protein